MTAVIHAAAIAYGFVFLHPFEDGNGRLSAQKRASHFDSLSEDEIAHMEQAIRTAYGKNNEPT